MPLQACIGVRCNVLPPCMCTCTARASSALPRCSCGLVTSRRSTTCSNHHGLPPSYKGSARGDAGACAVPVQRSRAKEPHGQMLSCVRPIKHQNQTAISAEERPHSTAVLHAHPHMEREAWHTVAACACSPWAHLHGVLHQAAVQSHVRVHVQRVPVPRRLLAVLRPATAHRSVHYPSIRGGGGYMRRPSA